MYNKIPHQSVNKIKFWTRKSKIKINLKTFLNNPNPVILNVVALCLLKRWTESVCGTHRSGNEYRWWCWLFVCSKSMKRNENCDETGTTLAKGILCLLPQCSHTSSGTENLVDLYCSLHSIVYYNCPIKYLSCNRNIIISLLLLNHTISPPLLHALKIKSRKLETKNESIITTRTQEGITKFKLKSIESLSLDLRRKPKERTEMVDLFLYIFKAKALQLS